MFYLVLVDVTHAVQDYITETREMAELSINSPYDSTRQITNQN